MRAALRRLEGRAPERSRGRHQPGQDARLERLVGHGRVEVGRASASASSSSRARIRSIRRISPASIPRSWMGQMSSIFLKSRSPARMSRPSREALEPRERVARVAPADRVEEGVDVLGGLVLHVRLDVGGPDPAALARPLEELLELHRERRRPGSRSGREDARRPRARARPPAPSRGPPRAAGAPAPRRRRPSFRGRGRGPRSPAPGPRPPAATTAVMSATVPSFSPRSSSDPQSGAQDRGAAALFFGHLLEDLGQQLRLVLAADLLRRGLRGLLGTPPSGRSSAARSDRACLNASRRLPCLPGLDAPWSAAARATPCRGGARCRARRSAAAKRASG